MAQRELGLEAKRTRQIWEISSGGRASVFSMSRKEERVFTLLTEGREDVCGFLGGGLA